MHSAEFFTAQGRLSDDAHAVQRKNAQAQAGWETQWKDGIQSQLGPAMTETTPPTCTSFLTSSSTS